MVNGEIKIGDRLTWDMTPDILTVERIDDDVYHVHSKLNGVTEGVTKATLVARLKRIDPGWTRVGDQLPGDDVDRVVVGCGNDMGLVVRDERGQGTGWKYLLGYTWTHWRPIPADWLPLPGGTDG